MFVVFSVGGGSGDEFDVGVIVFGVSVVVGIEVGVF